MKYACVQGRDKEEMQKLFHNAGMNLSNDAFNVIWDNASKQCDNNDGEVNIEDFRQALRAFQAGMIDRKMQTYQGIQGQYKYGLPR